MLLRAATAADLAELGAFLPKMLSGDWSEGALQKLLHTDHLLRVLTTRVDGGEVIVGFAECQQILDEGHLLDIAIAPAWQGRGFGKVLLDRLLAELVRLGCVKCLLEVRRSNTRAVQLYQRAGFSLDGIRKGYYPIPENVTALSGSAQNQRLVGAQRSLCEDALLYSLSLLPS